MKEDAVPAIEYLLNDYTILLSIDDSKFKHLVNFSKWCDSEDIPHITYNLNNENFNIEYWLENEANIIARVVKNLGIISKDFMDHFDKFAEYYDVSVSTLEQMVENIDVVKEVLRLTGSGYQKLFIMLLKAEKSRNASYYFLYLPETSLHPLLAEKVLDILRGCFKYMRFVLATNLDRIYEHAPYGYELDDHKRNVICV